MTLEDNSTMMEPMPTRYSALLAQVTWASTWYTSICIRHVALPLVEGAQAQARLASKNTLYLSCLARCPRGEIMVFIGLIKDRSLLAKSAPTMATLACWCVPIHTFAPMAPLGFCMMLSARLSTRTTSNTSWNLTM